MEIEKVSGLGTDVILNQAVRFRVNFNIFLLHGRHCPVL